jgi:hypothetical protein
MKQRPSAKELLQDRFIRSAKKVNVLGDMLERIETQRAAAQQSRDAVDISKMVKLIGDKYAG